MTASTDFPWSDEHVATLRRLYADGMSAGRIATELGCPTRNAVVGKIHRLRLVRDVTNLPRRQRKDLKPLEAKPRVRPFVPRKRIPWTEEREEEQRALLDVGCGERAVGAEMGVSRNVVHYRSKVAPLSVEGSPPQLVCEPTPSDGVLMHELEFGHCRWPLLDLPAGQGDEMRYCGGSRVARSVNGLHCPYCDEHSRMAYASPRSATQRAADERRRQAHLQRKRIAA